MKVSSLFVIFILLIGSLQGNTAQDSAQESSTPGPELKKSVDNNLALKKEELKIVRRTFTYQMLGLGGWLWSCFLVGVGSHPLSPLPCAFLAVPAAIGSLFLNKYEELNGYNFEHTNEEERRTAYRGQIIDTLIDHVINICDWQIHNRL